MLIKLILFVVVAFVVYKVFGGKFPQIGDNIKQKVAKKEETKKAEENTLVECRQCGTFVTRKEALEYKDWSYCSKECVNTAKKGQE
jgi:hypothetical protein